MTLRFFTRLVTVGLLGACVLAAGPVDAKKKKKKKADETEEPAKTEDSGSSASDAATPATPTSEAAATTPAPAATPPPAAPAAETAVPATSSGGGWLNSPADKSGRFMANLKIGPALLLASPTGAVGSIVTEFGWSVLPNKNLYLIVPLQFTFTAGSGSVIIPVGMQADFAPIPNLPNLYFYGRFSMGYAVSISSFSSPFVGTTTTVSHLGFLAPEFGIKYVINQRWNVGGEPLSIPVFFNSAGGSAFYRFLVSAGANF